MDYKVSYDNWLSNPLISNEAYNELKGITDEKDKEYRFGAELQFGTAGMRGIIGYGTNMMNVYTVRRATQGLAEYIKTLGSSAIKRGVAISYDTRKNSKLFAMQTAGVLINNGIKVFIYSEPRPVPMLSFAVRKYKAIAGVMITASHNPKEYNGYKVYGEDGAQMSPEATEVVVSYIKKIKDYFSVKATEITSLEQKVSGLNVIPNSFENKYIATLSRLSLSKQAVKRQGKNLKIVYTPLHGSGYVPVMKILKKLGINVNVVEEQIMPDENFSTVEVPNPENKEALTMAIKLADKLGADVVFGTDPDSDRLGVAIRDDEGKFVSLSGNQVGVLLLRYVLSRLKQDNKLPKNAVAIKSFVSTGLAKAVADYYGVELIEVPVGFKFIGEKIKQYEKDKSHTFVFGFEESCGYLRGTHARDKDAVVASMLFAEMVCYYTDKGSSVYKELQNVYETCGYVVDKTVSIKYEGLTAMADMNAVMDKMKNTKVESVGKLSVLAVRDYGKGERVTDKGSEKLEYSGVNCLYYELENGSFACLRPSGTEPKLKIYYSVKAKNESSANKVLAEIEKDFSQLLK